MAASQHHNQPPAGDPWTEAGRPTWRMDEVLAEAAARHPSATAVLGPDRTLSFEELADEVALIATGLADAGVGQGTRVAASLGGDALSVVTLYAISAAGGIVIPLNPYWTTEDVVDALHRGEASHLLSVATARGRETAAAAVRSPSLPAKPAFGTVDYEGIRWHGAQEAPSRPLDPDIATIMFTSGSTGRPKAALQSHAALVGVAHYYRHALRLTPDDRYLLLLPLYHTGGLVDGLLASHLAGTTIVLLPEFDPEAILEAYETHRITVTTAFESMLHKLLVTEGYSPRRHRWLKKAGLAGDVKTYNRLLDAGVELVIPSYGLTEACSGVSIARPERTDEERRGTVGEPLPGVVVQITDPETGAALAAGEEGEIWVRGWSLFSGYLDDPGVDEDGWLHTGDLGSFDENGALRFRGRTKNMIKSGGENVSEYEVESYLHQHVDGIRQACVVGVPDEEWTEMVVAYVEMSPGVTFDAERIRAICKQGLAGYKVPKRYWEVEPGGWPLLDSGKIDKVRMRVVAAQRKAQEERQ